MKLSNYISRTVKLTKAKRTMYAAVTVMSVAAVVCVFSFLIKPVIALSKTLIDDNGLISVPEGTQPTASGEVDNCVWNYYEDKGCHVLEITSDSDGKIPDYTSFSDTPWAEYADVLDGVLIGDGVTRVGDYAFEGLENLSAVDFRNAKSLQSMGKYSFSGLSSVVSKLDLSSCTNLSVIDDYAFNSFGSDKSVSLPANCQIETIGSHAFENCNFVEFPFEKLSNIKSFGEYAFASCTQLVKADLSNSKILTSLSSYLFSNCTEMISVKLPDDNSITEIEARAFQGLSNLESFDFNKLTKLKSIGSYAFYGCKFSTLDLSNCVMLETLDGFTNIRSLKKVILPDNSNIKVIGKDAFRSCSLTSFPFEKLVNLEKIDAYAFYSSYITIDKVDLSNSSNLNTLGIHAFREWNNLTEVKLCDNCPLEAMDESFISCYNLKKIIFNSLPSLKSVSLPFYGNSGLEEFNFQGCPNLENCTITYDADTVDLSGLTKLTSCKINGKARVVNFKDCTSLTSFSQYSPLAQMSYLEEVIFPPNWNGMIPANFFNKDINYPKNGILNLDDKYKRLNEYAYRDCNIREINLTSKNLSPNYMWASGYIKNSIFENSSASEGTVINIGPELSFVPTRIFLSGLNITEVHFAQNDKLTIYDDAFKAAGEPLAAMSNGDSYYVDDKGVVYSLDKTKLYYIPAGITEYTVPDTVTEIMPNSCKMADDLQKLTFADISKISGLSNYAFGNCENLSEISDGTTSAITVKQAKNLFQNSSIGNKAFYKTGLTDDESGVHTGELTSDRLDYISYNNKEDELYRIHASFDGEHQLLDEVEGESRIANIDKSDTKVYYYPTSTVGNINIAIESIGAQETQYARIYLNLSSSDFNIYDGMEVGDTKTILNDDGSKSIVTLKNVEGTDLYYLEMSLNPSTTCTLSIPLYVKNLSSSHETAKLWAEIIDDPDAPLKQTLNDTDKYQKAEWYTAIRRYDINKKQTSENPRLKLKAEGDKKVISFFGDITYKLTTTNASSLSDSKFGQDPAVYMEYTDVLTLPEKIHWKPEILDAVKNGKWGKQGDEVYVTLESQRLTIMTVSPNTDTTKDQMEDFKLSLDESEENIIVSWKIHNKLLDSSNSIYEMKNPETEISYKAADIFEFDSDYDASKDARLKNDVTQKIKYYFAREGKTEKFSDETIFKQTSSAETPIDIGAAAITLNKTYKNLGENGEKSASIKGGEKIDFYINAENVGVIPGTFNTVHDDLPYIYMIAPEDIEKMFDENKDFTLKILKCCLDSNIAESGPISATNMNGEENTVSPINSKYSNSYNKNLYLSMDEDNNIVVQVATFSNDSPYTPSKVETTYKVGGSDDCNYKTLKECFDAIGFYIIRETTYTCMWNVGNNETLDCGEKKQFVIYAHAKDTFESLWYDKDFHIAPIYTPSPVNNYAYLETSQTTVSAKSDLVQWYEDYYITKGFYNETAELQDKLSQNGDILRYQLNVWHYGNGVNKNLPLNDSMTGDQALLVPVAENKDVTNEKGEKLSELDLEVVKDKYDTEYYILNKNGTYKGLKFASDKADNLLIADSVTVSSSETNIIWYYPEISGTDYSPVYFRAISRKDVNGQNNNASGSVNNKVYLNNRSYKRLYAGIGDTVQYWNCNKNIVTGNAGEYKEKLAKYTDIDTGEKVVYKLEISAGQYNGEKTAFTSMYDVLPKTYGLFEWNKDNVHMDAITNLDEENNTWQDWRISDTDPDGNKTEGQQYIYWNNSKDDSDKTGKVVLGSPEKLSIYVTLDFPSDPQIWEEYIEKVNAESNKKLYNTFRVFGSIKEISHGIKEKCKAYLQKGVYNTYNFYSIDYTMPNNGFTDLKTKTKFFTQGNEKCVVVYYTTIYNSGNTRLYLTDIIDMLPKGFSYMSTVSVKDGAKYPEDKGGAVGYSVANTFTLSCNSTQSYNMSKLLSTVNDPKCPEINYKSAWIIPSVAKDGKSVTFSVQKEHKTNNGNGIITGDISYDEEAELCYLEKGEAISFGYRLVAGSEKDTIDVEQNTIAMQYYDYNTAGFSKAENVSVDVNEFTSQNNDGTCNYVDNINASLLGFKGTYQSDWLMSDVSVKKGKVVPSIEKHVTDAIDTEGVSRTVENGVVYNGEKVKWDITVGNEGDSTLSNYTFVDTMQAPYVFTGDVAFTCYKYNGTIKNNNYTPSTIINDITFIDADGDEITNALNDYNKEDITVKYSGITAKLGEEKALKICYDRINGENIYGNVYVKFDINDNGNLSMSLRFEDISEWDVSPGCHSVISVYTKLPKDVSAYSSFYNDAQINPNQEFNPELVDKGSVVYDDNNNAVGIKASDLVNISNWMSTSAWKEVEEVDFPENKADSRNSKNYIMLSDKTKEFKYTLNIAKQFDHASIDKMVIIDNLPLKGDYMAYAQGEPRNSQFRAVFANYDDDNFTVTVGDKILKRNDTSGLGYTIEVAESYDFDENDYKGKDGAAEWVSWEEASKMYANHECGLDKYNAFRIIIEGGNGIENKDAVKISYTAKIYGAAPYGKRAWNNFGYRYESEGLSLGASSNVVGVMTEKVPSIQKNLVTDTGSSVPAEVINKASASFIIYQGDKIDYTDEQDLLEKLSSGDINFTVFKLNSTQIKNGNAVQLSTCKKFTITEENGKYKYNQTDTPFLWETDSNYTVTEIEIPDNTEFQSIGGQETNGYTFNYVPDGKTIIVECDNVFHDYNITVNKKDESSQETQLQGAMIGQYGVFTANPDSDEYKTQIKEVWSKYFEDYVNAVKELQEKEKTNSALSSPSISQLDDVTTFEQFCEIPGAVSTLDSLDKIDSGFAQIYRIKNADSTETVYYYMQNKTTNENGTVSFNGVYQDNYAFLEMAAPDSYLLDLKLHTMEKAVDYGSTQYVDINDKKAIKLPDTGGFGIKGIVYGGMSIALLAVLGIRIYKKRVEEHS